MTRVLSTARSRPLAAAALALLLLAPPAAAGSDPGPRPGSDSATVRHAFDEVEHWVDVFDDTTRAAWQRPAALTAALGLAAGDTVADIGAGTGYFNRFFAAQVGDSGRVYAVDIEPGLVAHMTERARREGTPQVECILAAPDDPRLPAGIDLIFLCNTYHHIDARSAYFDRLRARLAPGGRLAIVDYKPGELPVGPAPAHKLAPEVVTSELAAAGYVLSESLDLLPYQYVLVFRPAPPSPDR